MAKSKTEDLGEFEELGTGVSAPTSSQGQTQTTTANATSGAATAAVKSETPQISKFRPGERSLTEIVSDLHKPIPHRFISHRKQGGKELAYIAWYDAARLLDHYAPGWSYEITNREWVNGVYFVTVRIWMLAKEGQFYRESIGNETWAEGEHIAYGDVSSNAESMAFRRAAAKWGLGLHLYTEK